MKLLKLAFYILGFFIIISLDIYAEEKTIEDDNYIPKSKYICDIQRDNASDKSVASLSVAANLFMRKYSINTFKEVDYNAMRIGFGAKFDTRLKYLFPILTLFEGKLSELLAPDSSKLNKHLFRESMISVIDFNRNATSRFQADWIKIAQSIGWVKFWGINNLLYSTLGISLSYSDFYPENGVFDNLRKDLIRKYSNFGISAYNEITYNYKHLNLSNKTELTRITDGPALNLFENSLLISYNTYQIKGSSEELDMQSRIHMLSTFSFGFKFQRIFIGNEASNAGYITIRADFKK